MTLIARVASAATLTIAAALLAAPTANAAGSPQLNGIFNRNYDGPATTFNGVPVPEPPYTTTVSFTTTCDASGCVTRLESLTDSLNERAPDTLDYHWVDDHWVSTVAYPWLCADGSYTPSSSTRTLTYNSDGTLSGLWTAVIESPGCSPGSSWVGPGTLVIPYTLVPA